MSLSGTNSGFDEFLRAVREDKSGDLFEEGCRWLLRFVEPYASTLHQVWRWRDWPNQWGADHGIDLVAETTSLDLWAIQAKAYAEGTTITKAHVDKFVAESSGVDAFGKPIFAQRLLIATTDKLDFAATRLCQRLRILTILKRDLERLPAVWPKADALLPPMRVRQRPRAHQDAAIRAIVEAFGQRHLERGLLVMASGVGKTLVSLRAAENLHSQKTLVVVPSLGLLGQTLRYWTVNRKTSFDSIAVCSDQTAVQATEEMPTAYVNELGFPATTNGDEIASSLSGNNPIVVFSTYKSLRSVADACRISGCGFDLLVADEAHRCAGSEQGIYALALDDAKLPARHRLFMTATPRHYSPDAQVRARMAGTRVNSMDDESLFGPVVHRFGFRSAIDAGLICDYRVVVIECRRDALADVRTRRLIAREGATNTDAETLASQVVTLKAMRDYDLRRVVTFHSTVAKAERFAGEIVEVAAWMLDDDRLGAGVRAEHISGRMSGGERNLRVQRFCAADLDARRVLANVRCLCEGVDVPPADAVMFADPQQSQADMIEAVSRALRRTPGKAMATIVIPVVVPEDGSSDSLLEESAFRTLLRVVEALRYHDDRPEKINELRFAVAAHRTAASRIHSAQAIVFDVPMLVEPAYARNFNALLRKRVDKASATAGNALSAVPPASEDQSDESPPDWSAAETLDRGLRSLRAYTARGMLGKVDRYKIRGSFPLATWWAGTLHVWQSGQLEDAQAAKNEISQRVSWLAVDAGTYPVVRADMAQLTTRPLAEIIECWLDAAAQHELSSDLRDFRKRCVAPGALTIATLCELVADAAASPEDQVATILSAASAVGPEMPYGEPAARRFADGFREGLAQGNFSGVYGARASADPYAKGERAAALWARRDEWR